MGGKIQQQQKENLYRGDDDGGVSKKPGIGLMAQSKHQPVSRQQERPEQQRAFLPRPQGGEFIGCGKISITVMVDVSNRKIVLESGSDQHDSSQKNQGKSGNTCAAGG